ncbi:MAG: hypothetical protein GXY48_14000 [Methanomicrobiales archaeon]|nr:hypothetical protein [Methanomicrobiales archaeon]
MFETSENTRKFFRNIDGFQTGLSERVPTFDRKIDTYFDKNFQTIIDEWGLITEADIREYERRLDHLSYEVGRLYAEKDTLKKRADSIGKAISDLEANK